MAAQIAKIVTLRTNRICQTGSATDQPFDRSILQREQEIGKDRQKNA